MRRGKAMRALIKQTGYLDYVEDLTKSRSIFAWTDDDGKRHRVLVTVKELEP